jgi:signal peptidase I
MDDYHFSPLPHERETEPVATPRSGAAKSFLREVLETVVLAGLIFALINLVSVRVQVESISMQPTLYAGEFVLVNKLAYKFGEPQRGDIIVFEQTFDPEEPYIKRIIGLPGDTVEIRGGRVYVNGNLLHEPYIKDSPRYEDSWVVPEGQLFVLGDNRNNSSDSHIWGFVSLDQVIGRAEAVYWPVSEWELLNHPYASAADDGQ